MSQPLVSLIIPVYNSQDYLDECLASAAGQTLPDLEIVCVDDGSTDGSPAILAAWAARDHRVVVITTANHGEGHARNLALEQARGRYLLFLDSDDTLAPAAAATLVAAAERDDCQIVVYGGDGVPADSWAYRVLHPRAVVRADPTAALFDEPGSYPLINKLIRGDLVSAHRLRFDQTLPLGADGAFWFAAFPHATRVAYLPDAFYHYRYHRAGATLSRFALDPSARVQGHLALIEAVCGAWARQEAGPGHDPRLLAWALALIAPDAAHLRAAERRQVSRDFADTIRRHQLVGAIDALDPATRRELRSLVLAQGVIAKTANRLRRVGLPGTAQAVGAHLRRRSGALKSHLRVQGFGTGSSA